MEMEIDKVMGMVMEIWMVMVVEIVMMGMEMVMVMEIELVMEMVMVMVMVMACDVRVNKWRQKGGGGFQVSSSSAAAKDDAESSSSGPLQIVFMMGGMTFSEMRCLYELAQNKNVDLLMGSTSTLTASQYIDDLSSANDLNDVDLELDLGDD